MFVAIVFLWLVMGVFCYAAFRGLRGRVIGQFAFAPRRAKVIAGYAFLAMAATSGIAIANVGGEAHGGLVATCVIAVICFGLLVLAIVWTWPTKSG